MSRTRSPCCARVSTGQATAPPSRVMNVRRLIAAPEAQTEHRSNYHVYSGRGLVCHAADRTYLSNQSSVRCQANLAAASS